jgi:hypothetical protein
MAVQVVQLFAPTVLTGSAATIYAAPSTPTSIAVARLRVRFANTSNASQSVTAYSVQSGGTAGPGNCVTNAQAIAANDHLDLDIPVLGPGGFLQAFASNASAVTISQLDGVIFS